MLEALSATHSISLESDTTARVQSDLGGSSSLILGKYLKNNLRGEFESEVRASLYASAVRGSSLIESIANLARPQREARPLDSIITFNFDDMIEEALNKASIPNKSIFSESIYHDSHQIPIYHVHGYLPRHGKLPETDLVFSEDAYHNQFIDPFSWSNLMQLNKLSQTTCLFIGVSLTDPNMRRLLDVAWRKNPGKTKSHYIVKKRPGSSIDKSTRKIAEIL
jgi:SIR2-like domain